MSWIGFITDCKSENYIRRILSQYKKDDGILFLREKNISNVKNIKFDILVINQKIENIQDLRKNLENTKYLIINTDIENDFSKIGKCNLTIITYGFNAKATITVSSVDEDTVFICIQRNIRIKNGKCIEPQEIQANIEQPCDIYSLLQIISVLLVENGNNIKNINVNA